MKKEKIILTISIIILIAIISILLINNLNKKPTGEYRQSTYNEIKEKIENKETFILIISQSTCSHCATYKPKIKTITEDYGIKAYYIDIDTEKNKDTLLKEFKLSGSTPTTLFFNEGKEKSILNRLEGDLGSNLVIKKLKEMGFITE